MRGSSVVLQTRFKSVVLPALARPMTRIRKFLYFWRALKALRSAMLIVDVKGQLLMHLPISSKCGMRHPTTWCDLLRLIWSTSTSQKIMAVDNNPLWTHDINCFGCWNVEMLTSYHIPATLELIINPWQISPVRATRMCERPNQTLNTKTVWRQWLQSALITLSEGIHYKLKKPMKYVW